jgi:hypothetical protein
MLSDHTQALLQLARDRIFQPVKVERLQIFGQARGLDRRAAMVHVVQQVKIAAVRGAYALHQFGHEAQIRRGFPDLFLGKPLLSRLIRLVALGHTVRADHSGHP